MADLSPIQIDLLRAGLIRPTPVGAFVDEAKDLQSRGLARLEGVRALKLKTTGDGTAALSKATRPIRTAFAGISATECNAWLATLQPVPLHGETGDV